jgi:hypothetical protein
MVGALLLRGMVVGLLAGLLSFGFLKLCGEPSLDRAIAFETHREGADADKAMGMAMPEEQPELVSRAVQAGLGLLTGVTVYGAALGGLFAIAFAFANGRLNSWGARANAAQLAAAGFVAVYLVPSVKYPASPPSVGRPETIGERTALYFAMIALSLIALMAAIALGRSLMARLGGWNAALAGGAAYIVAMIAAAVLLPGIDEVPEDFPAAVLWQFRLASLGNQAVLWATLGLGFGLLAERLLQTGRALPFGKPASIR